MRKSGDEERKNLRVQNSEKKEPFKAKKKIKKK